MVQPLSRPIYLRDADGGISPFDPERLQTRLIGAFCRAGLNEESYLSGELVLALEYTLRRAPRPDGIFNCGEVDAAMIHLLESNGLPEVANIFRHSGSEQLLLLETTAAAIGDLLAAHLGCSDSRREKIAAMSAEAMATLKIAAASPHLLLELARHYERTLAENDLLAADNCGENAAAVTLSRQEICQLLSPEVREWVEKDILHFSGVSSLFPGVRFDFFLTRFADFNHWSKPVTELELTPQLYRAGNALENIRNAIAEVMNLAELPACSLHIPDMFDFLAKCAGCLPTEKNAADFAAILTSGISGGISELAFD